MVIKYRKTHDVFRVFQDTRKSARRDGREFSLTKDVVESLITKPCSYCSSHERIGIDRADNNVGYTAENSVPCCARCNMLKKDMPLQAWLVLVPAVRMAFQAGLFGSWLDHTSKGITR